MLFVRADAMLIFVTGTMGYVPESDRISRYTAEGLLLMGGGGGGGGCRMKQDLLIL